jgi:tRNA dimethylallyltransferase
VNKNNPTKPDPPLLFLSGPTAVGKTELSLQIAERFSCEIIGVDSMQVYRYMDIGTAKPTVAERSRIPHYLIDIVDPDVNYTLGTFVRDAEEAIQNIFSNKNIPLLAGGTGLYFKGLLKGVFDEFAGTDGGSATNPEKRKLIKKNLQERLKEEGSSRLHSDLAALDPESAERIHPNDIQRIFRGLEIFYSTGIPWSRHLANQSGKKARYRVLNVGLTRPREELYTRIDQRVQQMAEQGLLTEVENLLTMGFDSTLKSMQSLGYRHMINFIEGNWSWEQTLELLARDTRHYAKRQFTWFKNDSEIIWHDVRETDAIFDDIRNFLKNNSSLPAQKQSCKNLSL